jgi:hypothetical protein
LTKLKKDHEQLVASKQIDDEQNLKNLTATKQKADLRVAAAKVCEKIFFH